MGKLHHLSYSRVHTYETCPEQYRLLKDVGVTDIPGWYHVGGGAFHRMTEDCDHAQFSGVKLTKTFNDYFDEELESTELSSGVPRSDWKVAGKKIKEDEKWWRLWGPSYVRSWFNWRDNAPFDIWVTPDGEPAIELGIELDLGGFLTVGSIDRVFQDRETGALIVVDMKTGKPPQTKTQLATYARALTDRGWDCHHGGFWMARGGVLLAVHDLSDMVGPQLDYEYSQAGRAIEADIFPPKPSGLCRDWCSASKFCYAGGYATTTEHYPFKVEETE
jgi:putative RecB family exonuclease